MTAAAEGSSAHTPDPAILRAAIHAIGDGVTIADADGRIVYSNPAADRILGVPATEAPPDDWFEHYGTFLLDGETPFPTEQYPLVLAIKGQSTDNVEMFVRNDSIPDGAFISVTGRPLRNSHGDIIGAAVAFRDITRLRRAEEQKRELTGFLIHDMKNPLTTILSNCDLVIRSDSLDDLDRESLRDIKAAGDRLNRMVLNLLDIQSAEDGHLEPQLRPLDVEEILREAVRGTRVRGRDVEIHIEAPASPSAQSVVADPSSRGLGLRFCRVAVEAHGGRIWVEDNDPVGASFCVELPRHDA